ncbi:hypothetical protein VP168E361_P0056 [Vibrio phage 168E36-1]|nr:hypothetical protein VP168E361_P0056 [Vibrio phage 168E36-1]
MENYETGSDRINAFYKANHNVHLMDHEVAVGAMVEQSNVTCWRHNAVRAGYCMESITVGTRFAFRFTGEVNRDNATITCGDPKLPACKPEVLEVAKSLLDPLVGRRYDTMLAVMKLNKKGYWSDRDLANELGLDNVNTASARRIRLVTDLDLDEHIRGLANNRERVIVGVLDPNKPKATPERIINWDFMPKPSVPKLETTASDKLLNGIFN